MPAEEQFLCSVCAGRCSIDEIRLLDDLPTSAIIHYVKTCPGSCRRIKVVQFSLAPSSAMHAITASGYHPTKSMHLYVREIRPYIRVHDEPRLLNDAIKSEPC